MKELYAQLSLREKRLLYILVCFLIVVAGWFFVIIPSIDNYQSVCKDYQEAVEKKSSLDTELQTYLDAPGLLASQKESYQIIIDKYNPLLTNEKIDKLLTTAFLSYGLNPISMEISNVSDSTASDSTDETTELSSNIIQAAVDVSVKGTFKQITDVVAYLSNMKGIEISTFNYGGDSSSSQTTMSIIVYMIKK